MKVKMCKEINLFPFIAFKSQIIPNSHVQAVIESNFLQ